MAHMQTQTERRPLSPAAPTSMPADRREAHGKAKTEERPHEARPARLSPDPLSGTDHYRLARPFELWL